MKRKITFIMPVLSDPEFRTKKEIVEVMAHTLGFEADLPSYTLKPEMADVVRVRSGGSKSSIVVADVSLERPSCYYELGVIEAMDVEVAVIAAMGTPIHQMHDRNAVRFYSGLSGFELLLADIIGKTPNP